MAKKIKKLAKKVAKKATKPLTKEQKKRVAIMKDAILQLNAEAYIATKGIYVDYELDDRICELEVSDDKKELKSFLPELVNYQKPCEVCAKGAIFLSGIRKFNNLTVMAAKGSILDTIAGDKARELVGAENADKIERYFENWSDDDKDEEDLINDWFAKYPEPLDRLIAILKNAVKHKGTFTPEKEKF